MTPTPSVPVSPAVPAAPFDAAPVPLWQLDAAGRLVWCNAAYAALFALDTAAVIAQQKMIPAKSAARVHIISNGKRILLALSTTALPDGGLLCAAQDVTREEELLSEHQRTQTATKELLEQLGTAVATFTADQRLEFFNFSNSCSCSGL